MNLHTSLFVLATGLGAAFQGAAANIQTANSIAKISIGADGQIHVIESGGREYVPPKEKGQISVASSMVAENKLAAGWLVEFENCCTSYPIALTLVIYRPGKALERFGNGMLIGDWHFEAGGKQVAFSTNTVHGDLAPHYELRDIRTGRLVSKWGINILVLPSPCAPCSWSA